MHEFYRSVTFCVDVVVVAVASGGKADDDDCDFYCCCFFSYFFLLSRWWRRRRKRDGYKSFDKTTFASTQTCARTTKLVVLLIVSLFLWFFARLTQKSHPKIMNSFGAFLATSKRRKKRRLYIISRSG